MEFNTALRRAIEDERRTDPVGFERLQQIARSLGDGYPEAAAFANGAAVEPQRLIREITRAFGKLKFPQTAAILEPLLAFAARLYGRRWLEENKKGGSRRDRPCSSSAVENGSVHVIFPGPSGNR